MEKKICTSVAQNGVVVLLLINAKLRQIQPLTLLDKLLLSILCFKIVVAVTEMILRLPLDRFQRVVFRIEVNLVSGEFQSPKNILTLSICQIFDFVFNTL